MTTLALDLGTCTGWAVGENIESAVSSVEKFHPGRFEGGGMKFLRFRRWLEEVLETSRIEEVVFEEVHRHLGTDAAHAYGGFLAILTATCESRSIPYRGVPVQAIKKHATGKGNANKEAMIAFCLERLGKSVKDDNEADAIWLLHLSLSGRR